VTIETYLDDLGTFLQTEGIGTLGTDIFFYGLDGASPNCISITPFISGKSSNSIVSGEINPYEPDISIIIRNSDAATALTKATTIYKLMRNISNRTLGTTRFILIQEHGPPGFIAQQDGYYYFSINFSLKIQ
jgi:hypothetical protein